MISHNDDNFIKNNRSRNKPLSISVCLATYNGDIYLSQQIRSILNQLQPWDELLVSDDGSTDSTLEILLSYESVLRVVGISRVGGVVPNFARVLEQAVGDLIVLADQDDVWLPGRLARLREELESADLVMMNARVVDSQLRSGTDMTLFDQLKPSTSFLRNLWKNTFVGCCMGFRRNLLQLALPIPSSTPWHDWLIGLLACRNGKIRFVDTPYLLYRRHDGNVSTTGNASPNGMIGKLALRLKIVRALFICLWRARSQSA